MTFTDSILRGVVSRCWLAIWCAIFAAASFAETPENTEPVGARPEINENFLSEDLDVEHYVEIFEGESREVSAHKENVVRALGLSAGMTVADIGAGTGLFLPSFDRGVGAKGRVYAVEISPKFLEYLRERADREGLSRVEVVEGLENSVELPPASVDLAFVCDTYHHFEHPQSTLKSLYRSIRPGGALVILDFERIPGETEDWILEHVRAGKEVFRKEIESAGFEFEREVDVEGLVENYVLRFRRP